MYLLSEKADCILTYLKVSWFLAYFLSLYQITPLHLAAERGHYKTIVVYLVDKGADVDTRDNNEVNSCCFELLMREDTVSIHYVLENEFFSFQAPK